MKIETAGDILDEMDRENGQGAARIDQPAATSLDGIDYDDDGDFIGRPASGSWLPFIAIVAVAAAIVIAVAWLGDVL